MRYLIVISISGYAILAQIQIVFALMHDAFHQLRAELAAPLQVLWAIAKAAGSCYEAAASMRLIYIYIYIHTSVQQRSVKNIR